MINRFFTTEERDGLKKVSTPYTSNLAQLVIEALDGSTASQPAYPELVKEYQRMVGSLMYCCTATRPDLAYAVHQHCRALSRPTPELLAELRVTFSYLNHHSSLGLTFEAGRRHELSGYSDSDWAIKNSTSGWVIFWHHHKLWWLVCMANCALSAAGPGIGSWFSFQVQCICLTVYHDLQLPRRLEIVLRIRAGPSGRFS